MKAIKHNRNIIATMFAVGLGMAATGAHAMTEPHDTLPVDKRGTELFMTDHSVPTDPAEIFVEVGGQVGFTAVPENNK